MNNSFIVGLPNNKKANLDTLSVEANGVYTPTSPVDGFSEVTVNVSASGGDGYVRVTGVPNGEEIIANAPDIEQGGIIYKPLYYLCERDINNNITFTKTGTGVSTGADAYVFSDEPTTLYVGTSVNHTFNTSLDYPTSEEWKCRYVIAYGTETNKANSSGITINLYYYRATFEFICANDTIIANSTSTLFGYGSDTLDRKCENIQYIDLTNALFGINPYISNANFCKYCSGLVEIKLPKRVAYISSTSFLAYCYSLKKIVIQNPSTDCNNINLLNCYSLKTVENSTFIIRLMEGFKYCSNLSYIDLSGINNGYGQNINNLQYCPYIVLPIDFDYAANFIGGQGINKSTNWLNTELPTKLKDNTGLTTKTLTLGSVNISLMTAETQTIIANKNWTLA